MDIKEFLDRLDGVKSCGSGWSAKCPAHDDQHNSLSISGGEDGRILLNCHAGCETKDIISALGLSMSDLFSEQMQKQPKARPQVVAMYDYKDDNGNLLSQKLRYSDKHFSWRRPDGKGGWIYNREGVPHRLYVAGQLGGQIFIVEGEKDADNVHKKIGGCAVSGADGAGPGKWRKEYTEQLRGTPVIILQDNDDVGRAFAQETAAALYGKAKSIRVLDLSQIWPEIPEHGDISDLIEAKGAAEAARQLVQLARDTPIWESPKQDTIPNSNGRLIKSAASFGDDNTRYLWHPYLPVADYTVMMADGGTGKTILSCGIAAHISTGRPLPGEVFSTEGQNVLIISAEDSGEILKKRLQLSGADLNRVFILDRTDSIGMNFSDGYDEFESTVKSCNPALIIIDPWHAFVGAGIDVNRINAVRPVFQRLANLAKICDAALILVSHVNKRAQGENANNAALGSADFINASRSTVRVIFDETDEDCRIMVHTKTNYAAYGKSIKYRINDGGIVWEGFSDITKRTLEDAARKRSTPWETLQGEKDRTIINNALIEALETSANQISPTRYSYDEFRSKYGDLIFGGSQPKRALDSVKNRLYDEGYFIKTGIQVRNGKDKGNGFLIQRIDNSLPEQNQIECT